MIVLFLLGLVLGYGWYWKFGNHKPRPASPATTITTLSTVSTSMAVAAPKPIPVAVPAIPAAGAAQAEATPSAVTPDATETTAQLDAAINEATQLLQNKDYVTFVQKFSAASASTSASRQARLDQMAQAMANPAISNEVDGYLTDLRSLSSLTPVISNNGKTATFQIIKADGSPKKIVMKQGSTGMWYFQTM